MSTTPDPSEDDLHDLEEAAHGNPLPRPAAEGVAAMQRELARLRQAMDNLLDQAHANPALLQSQFYRQLKRDLHDTQLRLNEYQAELDAGQN